MIIALDGPSGTGKSTVAKGVAKRLGFVFFDTGAMYRSVAWALLREGISLEDEPAIQRLMDRFQFELKTDPTGEKRYFVDHVDVTQKIRTQEIATLASQISTYAVVRKTLVKIQREFGYKANAVFEGRDMGTVVFPNAELKIFLTASPQVRAERRYQELCSKFPDLSVTLSQDQIERELAERDRTDSTRALSPLKQASDAILIDTSHLTAEQVIEKVLELYYQIKKLAAPMKPSYRWVYLLARTYFKLFFRLRIYGLSHFTKDSGIIAGNHASFFDPPVISISCPQEVHFLARESLFRIPLLGRLIRNLNSHPVARDASDVQTFRDLIRLLQEGQKVILFPEGKRSRDGELQPFEKGLAFLVYKAHCKIFPVYVAGTYDAWRRGKKFPKLFGRITCVFGSPIEWERFERLEKRDAMQQITQSTEQALHRLKQWLEEGAQGEPP